MRNYRFSKAVEASRINARERRKLPIDRWAEGTECRPYRPLLTQPSYSQVRAGSERRRRSGGFHRHGQRLKD